MTPELDLDAGSHATNLIRAALRSANIFLSQLFQHDIVVRPFSIGRTSGTDVDVNQSTNSFESGHDFEHRIFGDSTGTSQNSSSFYQKLDRVDVEKAQDRSDWGSKFNFRNKSESLDGLDESFTTFSDGMEEKSKKSATYFEFDVDEIMKDDYAF